MKKTFIKAIAALVCVCCVSMGWAQTLGADGSLFGKKFGTVRWGNGTSLNEKNEIIWVRDTGWPGIGWDLEGIDLSKYSGIRVEISGKADVGMKLYNAKGDSSWDFKVDKKGVAQINFNGVGTTYHEGKDSELDAAKGCKLFFVLGKNETKDEKTLIKKVEFIEKSGEDYSYLNVLGRRLGSHTQNCIVDGNTITWNKGENDFRCGWNLEGVDLSKYSRIKIELEQNELGDLEIELWGKDWKNRHTFRKSGPNEYTANLTGDGAISKFNDAVPFDLKKGLNIYLFKNTGTKKLSSPKKTVVKSVTLIKDANTKLKEFELLGKRLGSDSGWNSYISDNAEICWEKGKGGAIGWNFIGTDLTPYKNKKIRVELEYSDVDLYLRFEGEKFYAAFDRIAPNVYEAYISGKYASWKWDTVENYDYSKGLYLKLVTNINLKGIEKTVVKKVSILDTVESPVPGLNLAGVNLGTYRTDGSYIEGDNKIVWTQKVTNNCGWDLTGIDLTETPVVNIELESTDVPVRIMVCQAKTDEGNQYWYCFKDTASHCIQVDLSKKEGWDSVKKSKLSIEAKSNKSTFDISKGVVIYFQTVTNPSKPGKTTVVKKAELLKEYTK